jgi:hypothetical protein
MAVLSPASSQIICVRIVSCVDCCLSRCDSLLQNLETGQLVRPPAGHWRSGAQLLMQR